MRRYQHEITVPTPPEPLYSALADVRHWPAWDEGLERVEHDGRVEPGATFVLKPRGGPRVRMTIEAAEPGRRFVDLAHLPLARMRTSHELTPATGGGTTVRVVIEVFGPLAFLWDRVIARAQAAGVVAQTRALAAYAGARS